MRIGIGYDSHRLAENRKLILGGVEIPFELGLLGHSDADVLCHAIIDALLGAEGLPDIGNQFPDNCDEFKDADSIKLLKKTKTMITREIENVDCVIIAQKPKLAEFIPQMKKNVANALAIDFSNVNIKAKTAEGMDAVGRLEGIVAHAVVLLK